MLVCVAKNEEVADFALDDPFTFISARFEVTR